MIIEKIHHLSFINIITVFCSMIEFPTFYTVGSVIERSHDNDKLIIDDKLKVFQFYIE